MSRLQLHLLAAFFLGFTALLLAFAVELVSSSVAGVPARVGSPDPIAWLTGY